MRQSVGWIYPLIILGLGFGLAACNHSQPTQHGTPGHAITLQELPTDLQRQATIGLVWQQQQAWLMGPELLSEVEALRNGSFPDELFSRQQQRVIQHHREPAILFLRHQLHNGDHSTALLLAWLNDTDSIRILKRQLLEEDYFYGWEGPDYTTEKAYLQDHQYPRHMAYIAAIEYLTDKPLHEAFTLTDQQRQRLEAMAAKADPRAPRPEDAYQAKWLLQKLSPPTTQPQ